MTSKFKPAAIAAILPFALLPFGALAGKAEAYRVGMILSADGSGAALGDTRAVRRSSNAIEQIGCTLIAIESKPGDPASVRHLGSCRAHDATGRSVTCVTRNPRLLDAMQAATSYGFIRFDWRADGTCESIRHNYSSTLLP